MLDFSSTVTGRRSMVYIEAAAKEQGIEYDLSENHSNREALLRLWDACLAYDANDESLTPELLQAMCDDLLDASKVCILQGVRHKEPEDMAVYQKLFNTSIPRLNMIDVPYTPPTPINLAIHWELIADDEEVSKLTPGVQFKLPFDEMRES